MNLRNIASDVDKLMAAAMKLFQFLQSLYNSGGRKRWPKHVGGLQRFY